MSVFRKIPILNLFFEKALVGDAVNSLFGSKKARRPRDLKTYRQKYNTDPTVGVSIDTLSEMTAGCGHYTTVEEKKSEKALKIVNELADKIRLDEHLLNVDKCMNIYGFCPVERVTNRGPPSGINQLLLLDPETVEYFRDSKGKILKYEQKVGNKKITFRHNELIWFVNNQVGNAKGALYGISRIKRVLGLVTLREQVIENINGIMKNQARPPIIWKVQNQKDVATLKTILKNCRSADSDPVLYPKDAIEHEVVKLDPRSMYWEYVKYVDTLIFQGLHSPMLDYLRNATEASAKTMLDVIKRHVEGRQRYYKRMIEHEIYEFHLRRVGWKGEIPSFHFGQPQTGLEELDVGAFLTAGLKLGNLDTKQFLAILKQMGLDIPEAEEIQDNPCIPCDYKKQT